MGKCAAIMPAADRWLTLRSFGAVLEEFELHDALENVLAKKDPIPMISQPMAAQQIAAY